MSALDAAAARAYLLGRTSEQENEAIELEYFRDDDALETVEAAEEALVEEYLAGRLPGDDRAQFERHYLASPQHRRRVEAIRRLSQLGASGSAPVLHRPKPFTSRLLALAAGLVVVAGAGIWILYPRSQPVPLSPAAPPAPVKAFEFAVSPDTVRGAAGTPALVVPAGTDIVALRFESDANTRPVERGRIVIRTVAGVEVWQGPTAARNLPPGVAAIAEIPATRLPADDYIVTLVDVPASGAESERGRYLVRVRD